MHKKGTVDRRDFVKLLLAGGASSLAACATRPEEQLYSAIDMPEEMVPGRLLEYASVCRECPAGCGVTVRTQEARALKLEGIVDHPINHGALCARGQAALQGLYNPDRLRQPMRRTASGSLEPIEWDAAEALLVAELGRLAGEERTDGFAFLSGALGPSMDTLVSSFVQAYGDAGLWKYEPFAYAPMRAANRLCFGHEYLWRLRLERASMILSLGADFLETWLSPVEQARGYAAARRYREGMTGRHFQVEPRMSLTGANADEWTPIRGGTEHVFALAMLHDILANGLDSGLSPQGREDIVELAGPFAPERAAEITGVPRDLIVHLARTFALSSGAVALPSGAASSDATATAAHVAVNLLNWATGNIGVTIEPIDVPPVRSLSTHAEIAALIDRMSGGEIELLMIHEANPAFTLPAASDWIGAMARVPLVVSFASTLDETAGAADLVLPMPTPLEAWGDWQPRDGVVGLQQPSLRPLYDTRHPGDVLLGVAQALGGDTAAALPWQSFPDCLRDGWTRVWEELESSEPFESFWENALRAGGTWRDSAATALSLQADVFAGGWLPPDVETGSETSETATGSEDSEAATGTDGSPLFDLVLVPSLHHYDGRGANRSWLQEVPDPIAQVSWGPWVEVHPDAARRLGIREGDLLAVRSAQGEIRVPAIVNRWIHEGSVAVPLGQGHTGYGSVAQSSAGNPVQLLSWEVEDAPGTGWWPGQRVTLEALGPRQQLVSPRGGVQQEGRGIAESVALSSLRRGASGRAPAEKSALPPLYAPHEHPKHSWGMVIDAHACIGCNACAVACYAENNVPVVGREQMALGREMAWLRVEVYDEGTEDPDVRFLPMLCQQCHNAPCEPVCPVFATYHNPEGLNAQIYNRCVGTRYCSHNCPYKVRRFNWLQPEFPEPLNLQLNPNVTVRDAGVMEKCTFCIQRIRAGEHRAQDEGRKVRDGDIVPACAQTCPTDAIRFGDTLDVDSEINHLADDARAYSVLEHLNTQPAIVYLKKISAAE